MTVAACAALVIGLLVASVYPSQPRVIGDAGAPPASAVPTASAAITTRTAEASRTVTPTPSAESTPAAEPTRTAAARFSGSAALADIVALAKIGVRQGGSENERLGAELIASRLRSMGYDPEIREFALPNGKTSRNVVARAKGDSSRVILLGAHMDSKRPSPGANDNASGCAALLEIARNVAGRQHYATIEYVFFGNEEMIDSNPDHHHYGSRHFAKTLSPAELKAIDAMISIDMIGTGSTMVSRTMGIGPRTLSNLLVRRAKAAGVQLSYLRDPSVAGWSDHEPFERLGIPVSWIEWRNDPNYHTARDTADRVIKSRLKRAGQLALDFVLDADEATLKGL